MRTRLVAAMLVLAQASAAVVASVELPAIIADNMVVQQQSNVPIWGWADPNENVVVTASWDGREMHVVAGADRRWQTRLAAPAAGGPYTITVEGSNKIVLRNVLVGEVWVCSGQSNMQFTLGKGPRWMTGDINEATEVPAANYPAIRFFTVAPKYSDISQDDCSGAWVECSPDTVKNFSAVAYYFGRELHRRLNVPVGLICAAYGGTPAEAWMMRDAFAADSELADMLAQYDRDKAAFPKLRAQYEKEQAGWEAARAEAAADGTEFAVAAPRRPRRVPNQGSPAVLWNAMVNPIVPFGIRGVIWYQGESNHLSAWQYIRLFQVMIASWREAWRQGDFPFYYVQIAPYKDLGPEIREAQRIVSQKAPNTGMVVTTDVGDCNDIHPRNKRPVGERLARLALANTYGVSDIVFTGPVYERIEDTNDGRLILSFRHADGGLKSKSELTGFTLAGDDRKFVAANAKIDGNKVIVWSEEVDRPVAV
ncbi:MAG TPA: sialate O-acetylesterase, partial [Sedimentisphaerales bacterium]|nr:sialate O-acetylesterase [Sedimentisphaerales bacterium]